LPEIRDFFVERCLAVAGYALPTSTPAKDQRKPRAARKAA
jgi:hypothetical protein